MSMNINNFKNALTRGGVRPFLFRVQGSIGNVSLPSEVGYLCKAAQLPTSTIGEITIAYRGRQIKLPGERTYEAWNLTFLADGEFLLRNSLQRK